MPKKSLFSQSVAIEPYPPFSHIPYFIGLINFKRPGETRSKSSELPPGLPFLCLCKNALYLPSPNPGHAKRKSFIAKGSFNLPCRASSILTEPYCLFRMVDALDAKERAVRGSLSRGMWNKCGKQRYQFQTVMMILMVKP